MAAGKASYPLRRPSRAERSVPSGIGELGHRRLGLHRPVVQHSRRQEALTEGPRVVCRGIFGSDEDLLGVVDCPENWTPALPGSTMPVSVPLRSGRRRAEPAGGRSACSSSTSAPIRNLRLRLLSINSPLARAYVPKLISGRQVVCCLLDRGSPIALTVRTSLILRAQTPRYLSSGGARARRVSGCRACDRCG